MSDKLEQNSEISLGFRHVMEAAFLVGTIGGLTDVSYILTRSPDLIADFLLALRFVTAGIIITSVAMIPWLALVWVVLRLIILKRKWPLGFSLGIFYALAFLPAGVIIIRNFALLMAADSLLVTQVKTLFYSIKYLWVLIPVCLGSGLWAARLRLDHGFNQLLGRITAIAFSAAFYLLVTIYWQQVNILNKSNVSSELESDIENLIITVAVFVGSIILWPLANFVFLKFARPRNGGVLIAFIILGMVLPFLPPMYTASRLIGTPPSGAKLSSRPSNVLLVTLDTARYDEMGFNGSDVTETPVLDKLASESIIFDNAITPMPMTGPSHMSMLTGLQPDNDTGHGVKSNGVPINSDIPTLATILDQAGYETGAILSGFPLARRASGLERGFHYYHDDFETGLRSRFLPDQVWFLTAAKILRKAFNIRAGLPHGNTKTADVVTDQAIDWLNDNKDDSWFLFVHYFDAHYLYAPPPPFDNKYMPEYDGPWKDSALSMSDLMESLKTFSKDDFDYYRALYRGEISFVDQEFGRLLAYGNENNLWDNTLIIVVADHGEGFEHDYYFMHTDRVYDQLIHVPLIVRDPDTVQSGISNVRLDNIVNVSDIFYTVLKFLKLDPPRDVDTMHDGVFGAVPGWDHNLMGLASEDASGKKAGWEYIASQSYTFIAPGEMSLGRFFSFRHPDWKLIYGPDAEPTLPMYQYFDIANDQAELNDLFPSINWDNHKWSETPDILAYWASMQASQDLTNLDPAMRAQLKALGYINEGTASDAQTDNDEGSSQDNFLY